jgi:hypothetical protein
MEKHGVHLLSQFAIVCELMRDWRGTPGAKEVNPFLNTYYNVYGYLGRAHVAAVDSGEKAPGTGMDGGWPL